MLARARGAVLIAVLTLLPAVAAATDLYAIDLGTGEPPAPIFLRRVDPANGSTLSSVLVTLAGETVVGGDGLAQHPQSEVLFALLEVERREGGSRELVTLDPGTGVATSVGDTGEELVELTFDTAGTLFAVSNSSSTKPKTLFRLSPTDAQATAVLSLPNGDDEFGAARNIAFNADDGLLYHFAGGGIANQPAIGQVFERVDLDGPAVAAIPLPHQPNEPSGITYLPGTDGFLVAGSASSFAARLSAIVSGRR